MRNLPGVVGVAVALLAAAPMCPAADKPVLQTELNEQVVRVPTGSWSGELETTVFKPSGDGRFPLIVINHGKEHGDPRFQPRARYLVAAREFVQRGWVVVVPMRRGFAGSSGGYVDPGCNIASNGRIQADDVTATLDYFAKQPYVDPSAIIVAGQSHGGLTAMAVGVRNYPGVRGLINFAGGLKYDKFGCLWEAALTDAFASYAKDTHVPSLWFYGDNDSYWGAELPKRMHREYVAAGGRATLIAYGHFAGGDAHSMFYSPEGVAIWWPETERFLKSLGLPVALAYPVSNTAIPPQTDFAKLDEIDAVPFLNADGRDGYRKFLAAKMPRAFAISAGGQWGWAFGGYDPLARALANCRAKGESRCQLYSVDNSVVWIKP
ncbi:MAG TPA: CocE/NonD family hydrolase [Rhodocyclaceae bacterium]|nr:CocE/NonD family hydrolase [Rhodocyclaceae bacterium]